MCQDTSKEPAVEPSHGESVAAEAGATNMSCREIKRDSTSNKSDISRFPPLEADKKQTFFVRIA